jgi:serine phosphatase RsbU (regulator of sigma subunit)/CHASE3 domain sensor protein
LGKRAADVAAVGDRKRRSIVARFRNTRTGGTYTAGAVLAIALLVSIAGSIVTYVKVHSAFAQHSAVDQSMSQLAALFRMQLEEDTGVRGYLASGQRLYLVPYSLAEPEFDNTWRRLRDASARAGLQNGDVVLTDLRHSHDRWTNEVAKQLISRPTGPEALARLQLGKALVDRMRGDFAQLLSLYNAEAENASAHIQTLLLRAAISTAALILLFGFAAIVADLYRSRTQVELDRERVVADTLQRAFLSGWDSVPYLRVGTGYVSSTREAAVGGDLFDIHRIDDHRSLVLVADVSGKGINAAVETAQVKYSIRTLVEDYSDPAVVLARFNRTFIHSMRDPTSFVSAFVGILDDRDWTLRYASAGHSPTYIRRAASVEQLAVTGPVLGVSEAVVFSSATTLIQPGDTIVLATDGLTEARDSAGVLVDDDGVMRWIRDGEHEPEKLAAELIARVTRFAGGRINDDLALLIMRVEGAPAPSPQVPGPVASVGAATAGPAANS